MALHLLLLGAVRSEVCAGTAVFVIPNPSELNGGRM